MSDQAAPSLRSLFPQLEEHPVIGTLRRCPPRFVEKAVEIAAVEGLYTIEVTLDSEEALAAIVKLARVFPDLTVGAGSVLTPEQAVQAMGAGAGFVVTPVIDEETIRVCVDAGIPVIAGAATPSEIYRAIRWGATAAKVFPIAHLGDVAYLRAIAPPLRNPQLVPTGGVSSDRAEAFLDAGAVAIGAGSDLFPSAALRDGDALAITARARAWGKVGR